MSQHRWSAAGTEGIRRRLARLVAAGATALGAAVVPARDAAADPAGQLPARFTRSPYSLMSLSVGAPNEGRQIRARQLKPRPTLLIKPNSVLSSFGHPALVLMLERSADDVAAAYPGSVLLVGDLSTEQGGPLEGHRSHQSGRDADVAFYVRDEHGQSSRPERFVAFGADGHSLDRRGLVFDDQRNFALLARWARDPRARVTNVFVARHLRQRLLEHGAHAAERSLVDRIATLLSQPAGVGEHDDHFHVRIGCPPRQEAVCAEAPK